MAVRNTKRKAGDGLSIGRRKFLKRGAAVGAGLAALYVAPKMSTVVARPAYAAGTPPPCGDGQPPTIAFNMPTNAIVGDTIPVRGFAQDPDGLPFVSISLTDPTGASVVLVSVDRPCPTGLVDSGVTGQRLVNIVGDWTLTIFARDCCGQESTAPHTVQVAAPPG